MMEENKNLQPEETSPSQDVVFFAPEMLQLMESKQRQQREQLLDCREAAESGDGHAQVQMGLNHLYGTNGAQKDAAQAFHWFSQTAPDDPVGLYWLAVCHNSGAGTEKDTARAFELFRESAEMGYAPAQCDLGIFYENGIEVEQSMDTAIELYTQAAEQGYAMAKCNLGALYYFGAGVEQSYATAAHYFTEAAEARLARAQHLLGVCYEFGQGVEEDHKKAMLLYEEACRQGYPEGTHERNWQTRKSRNNE